MSDAAPSIAISHWADRENPTKRRLDTLEEWAEVVPLDPSGPRPSVVHMNWYVIDINPVVSLRGVEDGAEIYERLIRSRLSES